MCVPPPPAFAEAVVAADDTTGGHVSDIPDNQIEEVGAAFASMLVCCSITVVSSALAACINFRIQGNCGSVCVCVCVCVCAYACFMNCMCICIVL